MLVSVKKLVGVLGIGIFSLVWLIVKIVACVYVSGYISSTYLNLNGSIWWFTSIVIFSILLRCVVRRDSGEEYNKLVDTVTHRDNPIFKVLNENYGKYDTRIKFFEDSELIISKDTMVSVEGEFIFLHDGDESFSDSLYPVRQGFNIDTIDRVETIKE